MATKKMGFEGIIKYGVQGSVATTVISNSRDITETFEIEEGDTTVRGDGSAPPLKTSRVTARGYALDWQMLEKSDDATLSALKTAAVAGTPVAIRTIAHSTGTGFDGDMIIKFKKGVPLKGEQTVDFSGTPNDDNRAPQLEV